MKRGFLRIGLFAVFAAQLLSSCTKDDNNAPAATSKLLISIKSDNSVATFNGYSTTNSATSNTSGNATLIWTSGVANIDAFKFEANKDGAGIAVSSKGMANVDLFSLSSATTNSTIDKGVYTSIELKATLAKSTTSPSLILKGHFRESSGAIIPVELDYTDDAIIKAETKNVTVDGITDVNATLNLQLNRLITSIPAADFANAKISEGGTIVISSTSNTNIYNVMKSNISNNSGTADFYTSVKSN